MNGRKLMRLAHGLLCLCLVVVLGLAVAGCGSGAPTTETPGSPETAGPTETASLPASLDPYSAGGLAQGGPPPTASGTVQVPQGQASGTVQVPQGQVAKVFAEPYLNSTVVTTLSSGTAVEILCTARGDTVSNVSGQTSDLWDKTQYGYLPDVNVNTGTSQPVASSCS